MISALVAGLPLVLLSIILINAMSWRRPSPLDGPVGSARILIPARNEAARIGPTLKAALRECDVTVLDDQSTDETASIATSAGATVVRGTPLPTGWVGKVWAMEQLARSSEEEVLVFVDADVTLAPGAVARVVRELQTCDLFTAVPRQQTLTFAERVLLPLLHLSYAAWLPLELVERVQDRRFLAANGQLLAMRRSVFERLGGLDAVRSELVDDMAIGRMVKDAGLRVRFADGHELAETRMYDDAATVIAGFSKNIYEGLGSGFLLLVVLALHLWAFVLPYVALGTALAGWTDMWTAGWVGVSANLVLRSVLAYRHQHSVASVLLHPLAIVILCGTALNSWRWATKDRITWAGRTYSHHSRRPQG